MTNHLQKILSFALLLLLAAAAMGQRGTVTGVVSDALSGETLPGANIVIQGTTTGTVTDIDGQYSLVVPAGDVTLVASFIGYEPSVMSVTVGDGDIVTLNFALSMDVETLEEFVIIGYGVQRREDATGSISVVGTQDFNRGNITTPSELLSGKMAGVQITSGGGAPGAGETIRIRGGSSLSAINDPLIVIDGVPVDSRGIAGMRSDLSTINPNDIESFTVLKDASATAIYGSRASNGVILITTKKGKEDQPLRLSYSGTYSLSTIAKTVDVLSADQFVREIENRFAGQDAVLGLIDYDNIHSTNWQDQIFQQSVGYDQSISATGSFRSIPYRFSIGHSSHDGILKTDNMTRTTLSMGLNPSFFNDDLKVNFNLRGVNADNTFADTGAIGAAIAFDPTKPVYDEDDTLFGGYFAWIDKESGMPKPVATANPVALLNMRDDISTVNRLIGNVQFDYRLPFLPELRANLNLGYDYSKSEGSINVPDFAPFAFIRGGQIRNYDQEKKNELIDFYLNYQKELPSVQSRIDVMAGYSWQHFWEKGSAFDTNIPNNLSFREDPTITDSLYVFADTYYENENYLVSFFGRVNYSLMDRYLFTFTLRNDGSSRFVGDNQWGLFPSAAFAWRIDQEDFMQNQRLVSELKLRAGYGVTGQQDIGAGNYPALARYTYNIQGAYYFFGDERIPILRPEAYDADLKWEETTTYNLGFDYGFANDRFTGSLDFYFRETRDLINFIPVAAGTNLSNALLTNIGNLENRGVEFSINTRPIVRNDMVWRLGFNATYSETKITKLTASDDPSYLGVFVGGISGGVGNTVQIHTVGFAPNSFFVFQQVYDQDGNPIEGLYVDRNGDGQITDEDRYHHYKPTPDYFFGIYSAFQYKNWEFSFAGRANFGNYMYNNVSSMNGELSRLYRDEGPYLANITQDALETRFNNARYLSDHYIQNASFFKMDNISLSYFFDELLDTNIKLALTLTVQNAFVITKYDGMDPEIANGIDNNFYPRPRNFVLGVNLQF